MITVERTWGHYQVLHEEHNYKVKKLVIKPSRVLSFQKHSERYEFWSILSGTGIFTSMDMGHTKLKSFFAEQNSSAQIHPCDWHTISNISNTEDLVIIEVQQGVCDENDIARYVP